MDTERIVIASGGHSTPWEGCINSVNYRIERGVPVDVPKEVAKLIRQNMAAEKLSEMKLDRFTGERGIRL